MWRRVVAQLGLDRQCHCHLSTASNPGEEFSAGAAVRVAQERAQPFLTKILAHVDSGSRSRWIKNSLLFAAPACHKEHALN
jgi:hypothetical protein